MYGYGMRLHTMDAVKFASDLIDGGDTACDNGQLLAA